MEPVLPSSVPREAFDRWHDGTYSDAEASEISGLAARSLRDLAKWQAIATVAGSKGRGKRRLWKRPAICTAAMTAALQQVGLSLSMGARIAFHFWNIDPNSSFDPFLRFPTWDRLRSPYDFERDAEGGHPITRWLGDEFAAPHHDQDFDSFLHVVNGRFVIAISALPPSFQKFTAEAQMAFTDMLFAALGRIDDDGSQFFTWQRPRRTRLLNDEEQARWEAARAAGTDLLEFLSTLGPRWDIAEQYGDVIGLEFLNYRQETADIQAAREAFESFSTRATVNVTLAMRIAMRKALGLPAATN